MQQRPDPGRPIQNPPNLHNEDVESTRAGRGDGRDTTVQVTRDRPVAAPRQAPSHRYNAPPGSAMHANLMRSAYYGQESQDSAPLHRIPVPDALLCFLLTPIDLSTCFYYLYLLIYIFCLSSRIVSSF